MVPSESHLDLLSFQKFCTCFVSNKAQGAFSPRRAFTSQITWVQRRFKIALSSRTYIKFSHPILKEGKYPPGTVLHFCSKESEIHLSAFQKYFQLLLLILSKIQCNYLLIKTCFNMLAEKLIPFSFSALKQMKRRKELSSFISEIRSRYFLKFRSLPSVIFT